MNKPAIYFRGVPIHSCDKLPYGVEMTFIDNRIISETKMCPYCMEDIPMAENYGVEEHGEQGRTRHGSATFYLLLQKMAEIHDRKSHDYASDSNPSGNYHFAGKLASLFAHSHEDAGFVGRIGEKMYRLANLESSQKIAQNETIEDTENDIAVIVALWMADRRDRRMKKLEAIKKVRDQYSKGEWDGLTKNYICEWCRGQFQHDPIRLAVKIKELDTQYLSFCTKAHQDEYERKFGIPPNSEIKG